MSAIRAFFAKLPRPTARQAAVGATVSAVLGGGAWYVQQNVDGKDAAYEKLLEKIGMKKEEQRVAVEEAVPVQKEADSKPQQAAEEPTGK